MEVSVRMPSSTSTRFAPGTSTGMTCALNRPSWVALAGRRWLASAKRAMSSRATWNFSATSSPVIPMWNWLYASQRPSLTIASTNGTLLIPIPQRASFTMYGARLIDSIPPARRISAEPARIMSEANMTACSPEPQTLLIVTAPTRSGSPPKSAACLAGFWPRPAAITLPIRTSSMSAGTSPVRFTASATTVLPSLTASTLRKARPYLPTGVRHAPAITTSAREGPPSATQESLTIIKVGGPTRLRARCMHAPGLSRRNAARPSDPPRWGGRGANDGKRNQTGAARDDLRRDLAGGERGGHPDAHLEQHGVEGRAGGAAVRRGRAAEQGPRGAARYGGMGCLHRGVSTAAAGILPPAGLGDGRVGHARRPGADGHQGVSGVRRVAGAVERGHHPGGLGGACRPRAGACPRAVRGWRTPRSPGPGCDGRPRRAVPRPLRARA